LYCRWRRKQTIQAGIPKEKKSLRFSAIITGAS